ncbi:hypothetical protein [Coxiella-like endosymbiont]|uniref:hypothetical protein n=1 Tax=Coxiella-like endosymbiont TaxID=1592897 RepID=UPI00272D8CDD|nr:hypothetical protein [Coxiella-like endosymbiont]
MRLSTVHLPKLIGAPKAISCCGGSPISEKKAATLDIVDAAMPPRELKRAAHYFVLQNYFPLSQRMGLLFECRLVTTLGWGEYFIKN